MMVHLCNISLPEENTQNINSKRFQMIGNYISKYKLSNILGLNECSTVIPKISFP